MDKKKPIIIGVSGASGTILALRTIQALSEKNYSIFLVCTETAKQVWQIELGCSVEESINSTKGKITLFENDNLQSEIASGLSPIAGMVIIPCSMGTLSAIAHGVSDNLLERAADVTIKEARTLILVPRETPLSTIHLQNMLKLSKIGIKIIPPMLTFYHHPKSIDDLINFIVNRVVIAIEG